MFIVMVVARQVLKEDCYRSRGNHGRSHRTNMHIAAEVVLMAYVYLIASVIFAAADAWLVHRYKLPWWALYVGLLPTVLCAVLFYRELEGWDLSLWGFLGVSLIVILITALRIEGRRRN